MPGFEKDFPQYRAKVVAVGSGEAIELGRRGDADVLLVHSPDDELQLMSEGRGLWRSAVMSNDFVIAGPVSDPASIGTAASAVEAFASIASTPHLFLSRGDGSGTHRRETDVWRTAGISPRGSWYLSSGQGMAETLMIATEKGAYILIDHATLTVFRGKSELRTLFSDGSLTNSYSVIPIRDARHSGPAQEFARWLTGVRGQRLIARFGRSEHGRPLFDPAADADA